MVDIKLSIQDIKPVDASDVYFYLLAVVKQASLIFYEALLPGLHHDTGFLARTFEELRRYTGSSLPLPPLNNQTPTGSLKIYNHYGAKIPRLAQNAYQFGHVAISRELANLGMTFTSTLIYYPVNDFFGHPSGGTPWRATEQALQQAFSYLESKGIPSTGNFIAALIENRHAGQSITIAEFGG